MLQWLPDATRDPHGRVLAWVETDDPKGVLHTTESSGVPSYRGWADAPHATVTPRPGVGVTVRQHIPFDRASFALRHTDAQPTNTDYAFQFELVGTSDPHSPIKGAYLWPKADDAVLLDLYRKVIAPLDAAFVIPFRAPAFLAYPASAGQSSVRLTNAQWDGYTGWLGHQHVPQQDHGDPGAFPWARLVALSGATPKPHAVTGTIQGPLKVGSRGDSVALVQKFLGIPADGVFGPQTKVAVQNWQSRRGITVDGIVGPATATRMGFHYATA